MTEHEVQSQILDWLKLKRIFFWRSNTGAHASIYKGRRSFVRFGVKGSPDIFVVIAGHIYGIEVKGPKGKLSEHQERYRNAFTMARGTYIVAHSLRDVEAVLLGRPRDVR